MLVRHGEAVGTAPVGQVGFSFKWALLAHALIFFPQDVAGLRIDIPPHPRDRAADVENRRIHVADLFRAIGGKAETRIIGMLGDVNEIVVELR